VVPAERPAGNLAHLPGRATPRTTATSPFFPALAGRRRDWLSRDVVPGLTVWAVLVPEVVVLRPASGPYFGNADAIRARVLNEVPPSRP
jgi:hypothetical protein